MKKILAFIFLISSFAHAQYTIKGSMNPTLKTDWVILYKIEGARQVFVQNSKIAIDSVDLKGKKQAVGSFKFTVPKDTKIGAYRVTYSMKGPGFVNFIFNKEDVSFAFNSEFPNQTVSFSKSKENSYYTNYKTAISIAQQQLDSIQVTALQNPNLNLKNEYKTAFNKVNAIQNGYLEASKTMYIQPFLKATLRNNPSEILTTPEEYMSNMIGSFFDNINFNDNTLLNSSFLIDKITEYVFYINYSDDAATQQNLYKESITKVMAKIENISFRKDVIEFLISQFEESKNLELIDYLFNNYYNKLPETYQDKKFKTEKLGLLATEIGRTAPDFSWTENGKKLKLSELNDAQNYVLVFWSTTCSHCLNQIPKLHKYLKDNKKVKVIAFSLERNDIGWKTMKKTLPNWHHVLGLNKWSNKTARIYNINATPTYIILDSNKKIIAKPDSLKDIKAFFSKN